MSAAFEIALAAHETGNLDEAERGYRAALSASPTASPTHNLGLIYVDRWRYPEALEWLGLADRLQPGLSQLCWLWGECFCGFSGLRTPSTCCAGPSQSARGTAWRYTVSAGRYSCRGGIGRGGPALSPHPKAPENAGFQCPSGRWPNGDRLLENREKNPPMQGFCHA